MIFCPFLLEIFPFIYIFLAYVIFFNGLCIFVFLVFADVFVTKCFCSSCVFCPYFFLVVYFCPYYCSMVCRLSTTIFVFAVLVDVGL